MEFRILGPVGLWEEGTEVALDGPKQRTVLAALLLSGGRVLSDARLSSLLWGEKPPTTESAQIHTYVSRLRKRLGGRIEILRKRPGYLLRRGQEWFDYGEFEQLAHAGRDALASGQYEMATARLAKALSLWRGTALLGVTEYLSNTEAAWMEEQRVAALENRIDADLALGRHTQLVPELTRLVAANPLRETMRVQLMVALYRSGRQSDAFLIFREGRRILGEQLGVEPGAALRDAYQAVLTGAAEFDNAGHGLSGMVGQYAR